MRDFLHTNRQTKNSSKKREHTSHLTHYSNMILSTFFSTSRSHYLIMCQVALLTTLTPQSNTLMIHLAARLDYPGINHNSINSKVYIIYFLLK